MTETGNQSTPCPVCEWAGGFHDTDDPTGRHAAARARIPAELKRTQERTSNMNRPTPLRWIKTDNGEYPDCVRCEEWLWRPFMAEAIASVSIERPVDIHRILDRYHINRHREPA